MRSLLVAAHRIGVESKPGPRQQQVRNAVNDQHDPGWRGNTKKLATRQDPETALESGYGPALGHQ